MHKTQRSPKAKSVQIAHYTAEYCSHEFIKMNPSRISNINLLLQAEITNECPNIPKNISVRIKTYNAPNIRPATMCKDRRNIFKTFFKTRTIKT